MQEIQGKTRTVRELLSGAKYGIDYYQREYKRQTKQMVELVKARTGRPFKAFDQFKRADFDARFEAYRGIAEALCVEARSELTRGARSILTHP